MLFTVMIVHCHSTFCIGHCLNLPITVHSKSFFIMQMKAFSLFPASMVALSCNAFAPMSVLRPSVIIGRSSSTTSLGVSTATATALEELSKMTTISIDSGDLDVVAQYAKTGLVTDATTNPLFVSQAGANGDKRYSDMVFDAIMYAKEKMGGGDSPLADFEPEIDLAMDKLAVNLGAKLTEMVPGRVSTEVDIRLSYDTGASVQRARNIIKMYEEMGIDRSRILIKLAGTWEGIQAARILERENIQCNITLIFSFLQAAAAAQAGAYLVSPFPGRILDWHRTKSGKDSFHPTADPGVLQVKRMYAYFKKYGYKTICMPSSWRPSRGTGAVGSDVDEILALAGIDEMTIPPSLLESLLQRDAGDVVRECEANIDAATCCDPDFTLDEATYRAYWETDTCGKEKLDEGIDAFTRSTLELREILYNKFAEG
ncbi:transaldolase/EF-hand domain containing protein [Nitzschia inconspicua]|uniref:Transaldolase n=1 Tax=Nitzschia inconspicua TaxID=303405 RepID=A0A9K3PZ13_9STRA|nr:transaldolase/EF-hand domain containing protein [Nitzschia inconspicua]